jgi:hypothetical protein
MKNSAKKQLIIEALLTGDTLGQAAEKANIHRNTITLWVRDPEFVKELRAAEGEGLSALSHSLVKLAEKATSTLEEVLDDGETDGARLRACDIVLGRLIQMRELVDLEERIAELERMVQK